ncbi:hypothetical protein [Psychroflexus aestuariivivens]|uniref:hypothetical protein n=1 Tax=Psychroflexus aestuariivivens TaxID=1795040 RepID=UPI000FD98520|nr:hypothetical protein [Psychroflexus aestuariivivens]
MFFYKKYFGDIKTRIEYHFYNKQLFLKQISFPYLNDEEKEKIRALISQKYFIENTYLDSKAIIDPNANLFFINEGLVFNIYYVNQNNSTFNNALDYIENSGIELKNDNFEESIIFKNI